MMMIKKKAQTNNPFTGTWHIYEMEQWDEDYFNMETQAYFDIDQNQGEFQFGLVMGNLDGYIEDVEGSERFAFTWEGNDEMDEAMGSGWIKLISEDEIEGMINFHQGDHSGFKAKKAS
jgi:hypothetical protein